MKSRVPNTAAIAHRCSQCGFIVNIKHVLAKTKSGLEVYVPVDIYREVCPRCSNSVWTSRKSSLFIPVQSTVINCMNLWVETSKEKKIIINVPRDAAFKYEDQQRFKGKFTRCIEVLTPRETYHEVLEWVKEETKTQTKITNPSLLANEVEVVDFNSL